MNELTKNGTCVTVKVGPSINAKNSKELKETLRQVFEEGAERIVIDMSDTEIIDSIGLGLLAATHNSLKTRDSKLELINVRAEVFKVINLMRLDKYFLISSAEKPA